MYRWPRRLGEAHEAEVVTAPSEDEVTAALESAGVDLDLPLTDLCDALEHPEPTEAQIITMRCRVAVAQLPQRPHSLLVAYVEASK